MYATNERDLGNGAVYLLKQSCGLAKGQDSNKVVTFCIIFSRFVPLTLYKSMHINLDVYEEADEEKPFDDENTVAILDPKKGLHRITERGKCHRRRH